MAFGVKFSGLISQFRILEKSYSSPRTDQPTPIYIWSLVKVKQDFWYADEAFQIILLQRHNQFYGVVFS